MHNWVARLGCQNHWLATERAGRRHLVRNLSTLFPAVLQVLQASQRLWTLSYRLHAAQLGSLASLGALPPEVLAEIRDQRRGSQVAAAWLVAVPHSFLRAPHHRHHAASRPGPSRWMSLSLLETGVV